MRNETLLNQLISDYGVTVEENVYLTKDVDYTIDFGGLDFETAGTYVITYTYCKNSTITATLEIVVEVH